MRGFWRAAAYVGLGIGAALPGCDKQVPKAEPAEIAVDVKDPASVTRATYEALRGELHAIAERNPAEAERYRAFLRDRLLNFDEALINKAIANVPPKYRDAKLNAFKNDMIDMWGRIIAFYADDLKMETLRVEAAPAGEVGALITHVAAEHGDRKIGLKLVLRAGDSGAWFPMTIIHERADRRPDASVARRPPSAPPTPTSAPVSPSAAPSPAHGHDSAPSTGDARAPAGAPASAPASSPAPADEPAPARP